MTKGSPAPDLRQVSPACELQPEEIAAEATARTLGSYVVEHGKAGAQEA
jgi:hypothetical protein